MQDIIQTLVVAARTKARYRQTRDEIARLPTDIALDLGLYPGDADEIARKAVYGR
jgi:uncharacterized protein YjiS (DUF1127 family)